MKGIIFAGAALLSAVIPLNAQQAVGQSWQYRLLDGSYFQDDCLICGRPTIQQPLRGSFELLLVEQSDSAMRYLVTNVLFTTRADPPTTITGIGTFEVLGLTGAKQQSMVLDLKVNDSKKLFTNDIVTVARELPMTETHLVQTELNLLQFFSLNVAAAPLRDIWFTIGKDIFATNINQHVAAGDFLSDAGTVVRRATEVVDRFGFQPGPSSAPVTAVTVGPGAELLFALTRPEFSETSSVTCYPGDLLSDKGVLLVRNRDLLANFQPQPSDANFGLDALHVALDGELFFSVSTNFVSGRIGQISAGDVLSYRAGSEGPTNRLHATSQQLISLFQPLPADAQPGLDALYLWPSGEIWFSTERDFNSQTFGTLSSGDLLSSRGYIVFRNADLLWNFGPSPALDAGLTGLYVVTDALVQTNRPVFTRIQNAANALTMEWTGPGRAFQVEQTPDITQPFSPATAILPVISWTDSGGSTNARALFRLRQW